MTTESWKVIELKTILSKEAIKELYELIKQENVNQKIIMEFCEKYKEDLRKHAIEWKYFGYYLTFIFNVNLQ